ncbi:MAG: ATP-dependent Clp protease proteolytic subunit [Elusimicrobia bacterium]|nr:ATP-dependent Clp protease proteolytic subunit [Elusimicrobiota bacterium]
MKTAALAAFCALTLAASAFAAMPPGQTPSAQSAGPTVPGVLLPSQPSPPSPEQIELNKLTAENMISDQKTRKKLQQLNDEREGLRAEYELGALKQKSKMAALEAELEAATVENKLSGEKRHHDLAALQAEIDKTAAENKLAEEKRKAQNAALTAEYDLLWAQNRLAEERTKAALAQQDAELKRLNQEAGLSAAKNKVALLDLVQQLEKLKLANDLRAEQQREQQMADEKEKRAIELAVKRIELDERKLGYDKLLMDSRMAKLKSDLELRDKKWEWKKEANVDPTYMDQPYAKGRLVVSDRRITMDTPIFTGVSDYVTERLHYFNNISTQPIFIVIDRCPGGSVMEGYRIIKAMQASKAPVHVVVKSFAASMAAVITTMADKSYVYPNAIVLHHQMSTMNWGNMTQLKEQLELAREWERRLHLPVAKKMGISLEEFRKKMYEKNSNGDWEEFGDKAVSYKWATDVVEEIDETGFLKNPDTQPAQPKQMFWLNEKADEKGQRYVNLPRLDPFDFYFIYNPDRYYR